MDFFLVTLFLVLYYVRPHEWMEVMSRIEPVTKVMALALGAVIYFTGKRVSWRPDRFIAELFRTPVDWALLAFVLWILHASEDAGTVWGMLYALVAYYFVVAHALSTPRRIEGFMWVWLGLILFVSTMAVLSEYEIDPFGSYGWTHGMYKGRLVLNLSIFRNPNALAHSVILILPMIYFLGIWRRFLLVQELSLPLYILPFWCLYWTQSKGAFLSGGVGMVTTLTVGRPRWMQAAVLGLAYVVGISALMLLPRMHELESIRGDAGVKGRLLAWNFAWTCFETMPHGLGYRQFTRHVPVYTEGDISVRKPTHSSYVEVAAELGKTGLFLWLGILYYCLRALVFAKTQTDQEERLRRLLITLVVIYMASSWMTNISYRGTFFIQTGAVAALLRHLRRRRSEADGEDENGGREVSALPAAEVSASEAKPVGAPEAPAPAGLLESADHRSGEGEADDEGGVVASLWRSIRSAVSWRGIAVVGLDLLCIYVLYRAVVRAWLYFMLDWTGF